MSDEEFTFTPTYNSDADAKSDVLSPTISRTESETSTISSIDSQKPGPSSRVPKYGQRRRIGQTKKSNATLAKEQKRQKLAEEKLAKQAAAEKYRVCKPGECIKYMAVEMHPTLISEWYCADIERELQAVGARLMADPTMFDPNLVLWSRKLQPTFNVKDGQVGLSSAKEFSPVGVYLLTAEEVGKLGPRVADVVRHVASVSGRRLTLAVYGFKEYFKKSKRKVQSNGIRAISEIEMEMVFTDLLVSTGCDTVVVDEPNKLAQMIVRTTKAIAEEPYKKMRQAYDEQAAFYMQGDNKKCVAVDKDQGYFGLKRLWEQMVAVLPLSSLQTAKAVCSQYKSPLRLYEALQSPNGVNELADVEVFRSAAPEARGRRVGVEFARKLHILFTSDDGNEVIE